LNKKIKYSVIGLMISIVFFLIMGTPTALISTPLIKYSRMIPATFLDYFFLITTSVLLGTLISLKLYFNSKEKSEYKAAAGGIAGFIAFSCPICNVLLVSALGSATIMTFIEPLRPVLGIASIIILIYLIYRELTCKKCKKS